MPTAPETTTDDVREEPTAGVDSPVTPVTSTPHPGTRRALRWAGAFGLLGLLAGSGYQSWLLFVGHRTDIAARAALDTARDYAVTLTTADPATVDQQITRIINGSTGDFHDRYAKHSAELRSMLMTNKVTTRGQVVDSAVKSAGPQEATVLLVVRQFFTSAALPAAPPGRSAEPPPDVTSMSITLQKVDGRWLVSDVVPAQQETPEP